MPSRLSHPNELLQVLKSALEDRSLYFDVESNHAAVHRADWEFWGVGLTGKNHSIYVPAESEYAELAAKAIWAFDGDVIDHNPKFDLSALKKQFRLSGFPKSVVDTMIGMNLLNENINPKALGLKAIVLKLFDYEMERYDQAIIFGRHSDHFARYCEDDTIQVKRLWEWMKPRLEKEGLMDLFRKIRMRCLKTVADMEAYGFGWDLATAKELMLVYQEAAESKEAEARSVLGEGINLRSGDQLAARLFGKKSEGGLGIPTTGVPLTDSGKRYKVDSDTVEMLAPRFPIMRVIAEMSNAQSTITKYIWKLTEYAMADPNSRVHPETWLVSTTGRTRQQNPPCQTEPKTPKHDYVTDPELLKKGKRVFIEKYRIRRGHRARPGYKFLVADFSQFQLRLNAHIAPDPVMLKVFCSWKCTKCGSNGLSEKLLIECPKCHAKPNEAILKGDGALGFWHGEDLHQQTLENVNAFLGRPVLKDRRDAKDCNFALIFNATAWKMNLEHPRYSISEWDQIIKGFFNEKTGYVGTKVYHLKTERLLDTKGWVQDIFGARRRFSKGEIMKSRKHALNQAINFPVQSSEVNYAEYCMGLIQEDMIEQGMWNDGRVDTVGCCLAQFMHDELVIEAPDEMVSEASDIMLNRMRYAVPLKVPIDAELKVSDTW